MNKKKPIPKARLIKVDGTEADIVPINGKTFTLEELYKLIDCEIIETVPIQHYGDKGMLIILDETGKVVLPSKKYNTLATTLFLDGREGSGDYIVGDVVVCHKSQFK